MHTPNSSALALLVGLIAVIAALFLASKAVFFDPRSKSDCNTKSTITWLKRLGKKKHEGQSCVTWWQRDDEDPDPDNGLCRKGTKDADGDCAPVSLTPTLAALTVSGVAILGGIGFMVRDVVRR
jgi:hypothetical protein